MYDRKGSGNWRRFLPRPEAGYWAEIWSLEERVRVLAVFLLRVMIG